MSHLLHDTCPSGSRARPIHINGSRTGSNSMGFSRWTFYSPNRHVTHRLFSEEFSDLSHSERIPNEYAKRYKDIFSYFHFAQEFPVLFVYERCLSGKFFGKYNFGIQRILRSNLIQYFSFIEIEPVLKKKTKKKHGKF